jgi:Ion channel
MKEVGRFPLGLVCYCATCDRYLGWGKNEYLDEDFTCPDQPANQKHIARVVLNKAPAVYWLRIEYFLYFWQTRISPGAMLRRLCSSWEAGHSLTLWFGLVGLAILCESRYAPDSFFCSRAILVTILAVRIVDIVLIHLAITITSRFPGNRLRTVIFTLASYLQIVLIYAYFYAVGGKAWYPQYRALRDAVYFSFGSILTVGYGNLKPSELIPRAVVISELVLGLFFIVVIVGQVVAWASQPQHSRGEFSLEDVSLRS